MIDGEESVGKLKRLSESRALSLELKRSALEKYRKGEISLQPEIDISGDTDSWKKLVQEKGCRIP